MRWNQSPFGCPSRLLKDCLKRKLRERIAKAVPVVLFNDQKPVRDKGDEHSLFCLLEAFEHVNHFILLVQTKFSSRQRVYQRFRLGSCILEIVGLHDNVHSARCVSDAISGERTACNNACLACGVNSPPVLLSSSTATSF